MKKSLYVLLCAAALVSCGQPKQQQKAVADVVTSGNPIFEGWYADPEGIIYGDTYWVFPTWSDAYEKQTYFDCFSSKDLVNWTIIGAAIPNALTPIETPERPEHGNRVWAPAIRHHNGEFYIFWGDPDQGAFMVKAKDPKGPWSEPVLVKPGKGIIDTCPFWDEDGIYGTRIRRKSCRTEKCNHNLRTECRGNESNHSFPYHI